MVEDRALSGESRSFEIGERFVLPLDGCTIGAQVRDRDLSFRGIGKRVSDHGDVPV